MKPRTDILLICQTLLLTVLCQQPEICFENLECFPLVEPWTSQKRPIPPPEGPDIVRVDYQLYTWRYPKDPFIIYGDSNWNILDSDYDPRRTTYLVFHGFNATANISLIVTTKDALLKGTDCNVILVDYGSIKDHDYYRAVSNVRVVAAQVAKFFKYLIEVKGATPSKFHLTGLSLGAHVAAYVANRIPGVARLTGLDPAHFLFEGHDADVRIDKRDAEFVDIVHTNGNPTIPYAGFGISFPVGHVDFYFNGGWNQPGCTVDVAHNAFQSLVQGKFNLLDAVGQRIGCPHLRAMNYFAEAFSNRNCTFWGVRRKDARAFLTVLSGGWLSQFIATLTQCNLDTCIPFGFTTTDYPARGSFDVATLPNEPFCASRKDVDVSMERKIQELRSIQH